MNEKSLDDRLTSLEEELIKKKVGGKVINTKKPIEVFSEEEQSLKPFEIDEIKQINADNSQAENEKQSPQTTHEDEEDTSRIGRSGDLLKKEI